MLDLRDDGTIAIDFDGDTPTTVVFPRPIMMVVEEADIRRDEIARAPQALIEEMQARDPAPTPAEIARESRKLGADSAYGWWMLVAEMLGVVGDLPPREQWPPFMLYGPGVIATVLEHWNAVPLARGGKLVQTKN